MIFFAKRKNSPSQSSNTEACISILGLAVVIGLLSGAAALIYGLIKGSSSETIAGGAVLGGSVVCSILLVLICICYLKKDDNNSNLHEHRTSLHQPQHTQNHQMNRQRTSSNQITHISTVHKSDQHHHHHHQEQPNVYDVQMLSPSVHNVRLTDSTNHSYGKQTPQSSSKIRTASYSNQSHSSVVNQNYRLSINSNTHRNSYNQP